MHAILHSKSVKEKTGIILYFSMKNIYAETGCKALWKSSNSNTNVMDNLYKNRKC